MAQGVQGDNGELGTITEDSERETDGERENTDDTSSMDGKRKRSKI